MAAGLFARRLAVLLACLAAFAAPSGAGAQSLFERLVLPGPLTEPHAKLQNDCSNCHLSFLQSAQDELCLDCHKETAADFTQKTGFHGRNPEAQAFTCNHCHTDHEGRDFSIVDLDPEVFDHGMTDFALEGAHRSALCSSCHEENKPHREAPTACVACHEKDEPHNGALGKECASCHGETAWTELKPFDHSKTDFELKGEHADVACTACHQGEVWDGLPKTCIGCHAIQDVHRGRFGPKCESCHAETDWTKVRFDHDADTDFSLTGAHDKVECNACHTGPLETAKPGTGCVDCHAPDDPHANRLGSDCAGCHSTEDWLADIAFDHDIIGFPLIGLHVTATCEQCHADATFQSPGTECADCHAAEDTHRGTLGPECETCHTPNGWAFWIFDHNKQTDFTLTGKHEGLVCKACHTEGTKPDAIESKCVACHKDHDVHRGTFGPDCAACHGTETFKGARLR